MIVERLENWELHFESGPWRAAFEKLTSLTPDAAEGDFHVAGEAIRLTVVSYDTKLREEAILETHRNHLDVQMILSGSERVEWHPAAALKNRKPYNPERDATFYDPPGPGLVAIDLRPGMFAVFFPTDAHMAQLMIDGRPERVKKAVIKLRLDLINPAWGAIRYE